MGMVDFVDYPQTLDHSIKEACVSVIPGHILALVRALTLALNVALSCALAVICALLFL